MSVVTREAPRPKGGSVAFYEKEIPRLKRRIERVT